jgi:hypothetical protein
MMVGAPYILHNKWPHVACYTIEIMNHCLATAIPNGKTPCQLLLEFMNIPNPIPNLYALHTFGEPGWVHIPEQHHTQGNKFSPPATKQYLVGCEASASTLCRILLQTRPLAQAVSSELWYLFVRLARLAFDLLLLQHLRLSLHLSFTMSSVLT